MKNTQTQKGALWIIITIIVAVVLIIAGGVYFYISHTHKKSTGPALPLTKIYSVQNGGIIFKYPESYCKTDTTVSGTETISVANTKSCGTASLINSQNSESLSISVATTTDALKSLDAWHANYLTALKRGNVTIVKDEKITLNGKAAVRLTIKGSQGEYYMIAVFHENKMYIMTVTPDTSATLSKIVASIIFINHKK